eukprot:TRINITY_DN20998_c0_g1_i2.p1 TRINITY_DN20998_c0_g1~~TRINITY_DN20998_c0_g1_i2.p1  ORF type:complete len:1641 (-),score=312.50 TRINITY_DN20998_c0_g1_i2:144-5066(-)
MKQVLLRSNRCRSHSMLSRLLVFLMASGGAAQTTTASEEIAPEVACPSAVVKAGDASLSLRVQGSKTRRQCKARCSWQGSSFIQYKSVHEVGECWCGRAGLSYDDVIVAKSTNRKPSAGIAEAASCTESDSRENTWCVLEICAQAESSGAQEYSSTNAGQCGEDGLLRRSQGILSLQACQALCTKELDCRFFSYNDSPNAEFGYCSRHSTCDEVRTPEKTTYKSFVKDSIGHDRPPSWRLYTSSTWKRGARNGPNCWRASSLEFFSSDDCTTGKIQVPVSQMIRSGPGTATDALQSADGEYGASEVYIGAKEVLGVRCIQIKQLPSGISAGDDNGCRPLSNLEVQIGDHAKPSSWKTVLNVPWSIRKDGLNTFPKLGTATWAMVSEDGLESSPKVLTCTFIINDYLRSMVYGGVDLMSVAGLGEGDSSKVRVASFEVKPGAYLTITGEDSEGDLYNTGGFWADCGSLAPGSDMMNSWELYCDSKQIDIEHRHGSGAGWFPPREHSTQTTEKSLKRNTKFTFGDEVTKDSMGSSSRFCAYRLLPKKAVSWATMRSAGIYGDVQMLSAEANKIYRSSSSYIVRRECSDCIDTHKEIYLKRKSDAASWNASSELFVKWNSEGLHTKFDLYSTYQDALDDTNPWQVCDTTSQSDAGFPGNCGPDKVPTEEQWTSLTVGAGKLSYRYSVHKVGARQQARFAHFSVGLCAGKGMRAAIDASTLEECQDLCAREDLCAYVSYGGSSKTSCHLFSATSCMRLKVPQECDDVACGYASWMKQSEQYIDCELIVNDKVMSVFYANVDIIDYVTNTPGGKEDLRKLSVPSFSGAYLVITAYNPVGDTTFWADCTIMPARTLASTWESYCSDKPIDEAHSRGRGAGWVKAAKTSNGYASVLGEVGMSHCAFRSVPVNPRPVFLDTWCRQATIFDSWPSTDAFPSAASCSSECSRTANCIFFGYGKDVRIDSTRCAFFADCKEQRRYGDYGDNNALSIHSGFHIYMAVPMSTKLVCSVKPQTLDDTDMFYITHVLPKFKDFKVPVRPDAYFVAFGRVGGTGFWADCNLAPRSSMAASWEIFCASTIDTIHRMGGGDGWQAPHIVENQMTGYNSQENCAFRMNPYSLYLAGKEAARQKPTDKEVVPQILSEDKGDVPSASYQLLGRGSCVGDELDFTPDVVTEKACQDLCSKAPDCTAVSYCDDFSVCRGFCSLFRGSVTSLDNQYSSACWLKGEVTTGPIEAGSTEWQLVFRQTHPYLFGDKEFSKNPEDSSSDNFAILDRLFEFKINGSFTFKLSWPDKSLDMPDQIWSQSSNPVTAPVGPIGHVGQVNGYRAIDAPHSIFGWGGLQRSKRGSLLDGSVDSIDDWAYYAVGQTKDVGGLPGPGIKVQKVELYALKLSGVKVTPAEEGEEIEELKGQCRMSQPVKGDAPGAAMLSPRYAAFYEDCSDLCQATVMCKAIIYSASTSICRLLRQHWKPYYSHQAAGRDEVVASKKCGEFTCPYRYFMLDVTESENDAAGWHVPEMELQGRGGKVSVPDRPGSVYIIDERPLSAQDLSSKGTEASQAFDGSLTTMASTLNKAAKLVIDLGGKQHVKELTLKATQSPTPKGSGYPKKLSVKGSNDYTSWETLAEVSDLGMSGGNGRISMTCPRVAFF